MLNAALAAAGLRPLFAHVLSVERVRKFKTAPEAYQLGPDVFGRPASELLFVSSNGWDVVGAAWFGYPAYWINRASAPAERLEAPAYAVGRTMNDLVAWLGLLKVRMSGQMSRATSTPRSCLADRVPSTGGSPASLARFRNRPRVHRDIDDLVQGFAAGAACRLDGHAAHHGDDVARESCRVRTDRKIALTDRAYEPVADGFLLRGSGVYASPPAGDRSPRIRPAPHAP